MLVTIHPKPFKVNIDDCIADEIVRLNACGVRTVNSCCGHGEYKPTAIIENNHNSLQSARDLKYKTESLRGDDILFSKIELKSKCICKRNNSNQIN